MTVTAKGRDWGTQEIGRWADLGGPGGEYAFHPDDAEGEAQLDGKLMLVYTGDTCFGPEFERGNAIGLLFEGDPDADDLYDPELYRVYKLTPAA